MYAVSETNVNTAYTSAMHLIDRWGVQEDSRNGPVKVLPEPLFTTVESPFQRVLLNPDRRANPFLHLFEAFWMLGGRRDAAFLNNYVGDFGARFAEDDGLLWGAYGHRWRKWFDFDQLDHVVTALRRNPQSRREVITMWDPSADLGAERRDIPCNTHIYLRIRNAYGMGVSELELTVCCRSNDLVWGLFGSNIVHFSVLQEYLAWRIGVEVGSLSILSNNAHVYDATAHLFDKKRQPHDPYENGEVSGTPLFAGADPGTFDLELEAWLEDPTELVPIESPGFRKFKPEEKVIGPAWGDRHGNWYKKVDPAWSAAPIFANLLVPMAQVHAAYRESGTWDALQLVKNIKHNDWAAAATLWLSQRPGLVTAPHKPEGV